MFRIDGEQVEGFRDLTLETKVLVLGCSSRFHSLHGLEVLFDKGTIFNERESVVRNLLNTQAGLWYESSKKEHPTDTRLRVSSLERRKKLIDLASDDLKTRIRKLERKES